MKTKEKDVDRHVVNNHSKQFEATWKVKVRGVLEEIITTRDMLSRFMSIVCEVSEIFWRTGHMKSANAHGA